MDSETIPNTDKVDDKSIKSDLERLPVEMLDNVFKFVHPNDLVAISLTCKSFKSLAESCFQKNFKCGRIKIRTGLYNNSKIERLKGKPFELRFGSFIDDICLIIGTNESSATEKLFQIVKLKCVQQLRRLELDFYGSNCHSYPFVRWDNDNFEIISEQITDLELLYLRKVPCINVFLKQCKNLQSLCVSRPGIVINGTEDDWTNSVNQNLQIFILADQMLEGKGFNRLPSYQKSTDLTNFLQNAPELKAICLNNYSAICSFLQSTGNVFYASLWFRSCHTLEVVLDAIYKCCKENRIDALHLGADGNADVINKTRHLSCVKGFHCFFKFTDFFKNFKIHEHLEILCLQSRNRICKDDVYQIIQSFPNLRELFIKVRRITAHNFTAIDALKAFVGELKFLKRLHLFVIDPNFRPLLTRDDMIEMDLARSKLNGSSFLTIQVNSDVYANKLKNISIISSRGRLVHCVSCEMFTWTTNCPEYEIVSEYLKTLPTLDK